MATFDPRYKLLLHIVQLVLIHVAIGLSAPAIFMKDQPRTRASTIALGMGAKSILFIGYQILTERFAPFRRWASLKANAIINSLETIFWSAVVFLIVQANINSCVGISCGLRWGVMATSIILVVLSAYAAAISILEFRKFKKNFVDLEESVIDPGKSSYGEGIALASVANKERSHLRPE